MFNTSKKPGAARVDQIDTIIGENAVVEGLIKTKGTTRIDGRVKGEGKSEGLLIIGETGVVEGDVTAESMLVAGTVKGNLYVKDKLEITETGKITGDIVTRTLVISEGASFEGKCMMATGKEGQVGNDNKKEAGAYDGNTGSDEKQEAAAGAGQNSGKGKTEKS